MFVMGVGPCLGGGLPAFKRVYGINTGIKEVQEREKGLQPIGQGR